MRRFGFGFVVGILVLFIGASLAIDMLFSISLPIFRAALAFLLIAIGVRILLRAGHRDLAGTSSGEAWLADRHFTPEGVLNGNTRFDVVFGRGVIDLTHVESPAEDVTVTVDAMFGSAVVRVDPKVAYDVVGSSTFGEVRMPDRSAASLGNVEYHPANQGAPHLHIKLNAVFGAAHVVEG